MKAVLVVEMPTSCSMCWLDSTCKVWQEEPTKWTGFNDRLEGCPLKPMPHSKQMENRWFSDDYSKGWNDCLEEIEK